MSHVVYYPVTIASGQSLSAAVDLRTVKDINGEPVPYGFYLFGLDTPAGLTGGALTIYAKHADGTYRPARNQLGEYLEIIAGASEPIRFDNLSPFSALTDIKILAGTIASPAVQGADRVLTLVLRAV